MGEIIPWLSKCCPLFLGFIRFPQPRPGNDSSMFTKLLQGTLEKELPTQTQPEEKFREINAELKRRVAERTVRLETANAELRGHVAERGTVEDQLKTSLWE